MLYSFEKFSPQLPVSGRYFIAPGAQVIGDVRLEDDANIWFNAVLRGDNEPIVVGARANVQDGCVLHTDPGFPLTIGADVTIGHNVILHGCTIGEGALIGMGAVLLNGVRIGRNCIVGANALVPEGKIFPDDSMIIGAPARLVRPLDGPQAMAGRMTAAHYVARAQRFAKGLSRYENPAHI